MALKPPPIGEQPPPELPAVTGMSDQLANYLRTFSLWCRNGFRTKLDLDTAAPGILLMAHDAPAGTMPKVFLIQVNTAGTITATSQPLGSGKP